MDFHADLTDLPFEDARWDFLVCAHVLEHTPDDRAALSEITCGLSPGTKSLIVVPRLASVPTDEDAGLPDAERISRFGQRDHVRIYGDDLEDRLGAAGLVVISIAADAHAAELRDRFGLEPRGGSPRPGDAAYICSKAA